MRRIARRSLFEKQASGWPARQRSRSFTTTSSTAAPAALRTALHENLHELGGAALSGGAATTDLSAAAARVDHLAGWFGAVAHTAQGAAAKLRFAAYKADRRPADR